MTKSVQAITINSRNFGELNGTTIYLTKDLFERLTEEKSRRENITMVKMLETGRALAGLKHLITVILETNKNGKLIFCSDKTKKQGNDYYINFDEYRKTSQARFFPIYRERGLDTAQFYLNKYFPSEFEYTPGDLKASDIRKVEKQLPGVLGSISEKEKNQIYLLQETNRILRSKLRRKSKTLKGLLEELRKESNISFYTAGLDELRTRLAGSRDFPEKSGENSWQRWIYENSWFFGIQHLRPIQNEKIGFDNIPDYVFPTRDGFLDILEIKKPKFEVLKKDESHVGSYAWCPETNKAIGQVITYIQEMEKHQYEIRDRINEEYEKEYGMSVYVVRPRAFILIGKSENWDIAKKRAFRRLNYSLHGIEVITYSDLVDRGESIISMLSKQE